jgi:cysteine synthase B
MNALATYVEEGVGAARHPLLDQVGNTPLLPLQAIGKDLPPAVRLRGKAEFRNPTGSVKDRPAAGILTAALADGAFDGGRALLDSTSGNMGIAYAAFGAGLGIPVHLAVPANASPARLATMRAFGAELTLTDPLEGSDGARVAAAGMAAAEGDRYYFANQYSNPNNWRAHYRTTGPELVAGTGGRLTHVVAGMGTSGTLMGIGRYLADQGLSVERVAVQPDGPLHGLEGLKHYPSTPTPPIYDPSLVDRIETVATEDAYRMTRRLAREEGLLVGVSAGAAALAGLRLASELAQGDVVVILPDHGDRYLDEPFWQGERP